MGGLTLNVSGWLGLIVCVVSTVARGQTLRGTATDPMGRVIEGVTIQLLDGERATVRTRSAADGSYNLSALRPGNYRLQALRVGYRPFVSGPIHLDASQAVELRIALEPIGIALDTVRVVASTQCVGDAAETGSLEAAAWEQARAAIAAASAAADLHDWKSVGVNFQRTTDPQGRRLSAASALIIEDSSARLWQSASAESLTENGYVTTDRDGSRIYHAPDLDVLSSSEFLQTHCFRLAESSDSNFLAVSFAPRSKRPSKPDIRGTTYLSRHSGAPTRLDFEYVGVSGNPDDAPATGELRFASLDSTLWTIAEWQLRLPVVESRLSNLPGAKVGRHGGATTELSGYRIVGGELSVVVRGKDTVWARQPTTMTLNVFDSRTRRPIAGARVTFQESNATAISNSKGEVTIDEARPGRYTLLVTSPSLDSVAAHARIGVALTGESSLSINVPDAASVLPELCPAVANTADRQSLSVLAGKVDRSRTDSERTFVTAQWVDASSERRSSIAAVNDGGRFRICGIPGTARVQAWAYTQDLIAPPTEVPTSATALRFAALPAPSVRTLTIRAIVQDQNGTPVPFAEVVADSAATRSDSSGSFSIGVKVNAATRLTIRRIGYTQLDTIIRVAPFPVGDLRFRLERVQALDSVVVNASNTRAADFDDNRRIGLGHFLTRADLAKVEEQRLSEVLAQLPGLRVLRGMGQGNTAYVASGRGPRSLNTSCPSFEGKAPSNGCGECMAQVYLDGAPLYRNPTTDLVPDINRFRPSEIESIEYYASAAQTPAKYSALNSGCGVLVIHTRRTP